MEDRGMMKQPRIHDDAHLDFIRALPCLVCGDNTSTEAAHIRFGDLRVDKRPTGMGEKPSDCWVVPLCGDCHRIQHEMSERQFWADAGIDPILVAMALYRISGDHERGCRIVQAIRELATSPT